MAEKKKSRKFPFKKPQGSSEHNWYNFGIGTVREVQCGLCGTRHPKLSDSDDSYSIGIFLGVHYVEECCGAVVDRVYKEFGSEFACAFLKEFAEDPMNCKFGVMLVTLEGALAKALAKTKETGDNIAKFSDQLDAIKK